MTTELKTDTFTTASRTLLEKINLSLFPSTDEIGQVGLQECLKRVKESGSRVSAINNRRYLGNKHALSDFIRSSVDKHCPESETIIDIFAGTGAVANAFIDKTIITNDILYSNYLSAKCWFSPEGYRPDLVALIIDFLNRIETQEENYVRQNFADTYFSADDCSKIGLARELIELLWNRAIVSEREYAILITSILYGMDRIANTVGHYDAYRKNIVFNRDLIFPILFPEIDLSGSNKTYNQDANGLVGQLKADLLYCDPPYNSRQYSDAYHFLENIARWKKPEVHGVARKMDRKKLKSEYNSVRAPEALRDLVANAQVKYIVISYNNMASKGHGRSNAKIGDSEILDILREKGEVTILEKTHRPFSTGKSNIADNVERLFICKVAEVNETTGAQVLSPINYIGGKGKLLPQLLPLLPSSKMFVDVFAGGCTVGANAEADEIVFNDNNHQLMDMMRFLVETDPKIIIENVDALVDEYGMSNTFVRTYADYGAESSKGLGDFNREGYLRLRRAYNEMSRSANRNLLLYTLIVFSFNNQLRFNKKAEFNLPVGKRDFNASMRRKLTSFYQRLHGRDISFQSQDFRDLNAADFPLDTIFYCDPPYLITQAPYNEQGGWTDQDESDLLGFLDRVHASGRKFALSNVLEAKGRSNSLLKEWSERTDYTVHRLRANYSNANYQRSGRESATVEVLITNF